MSLIVWNLQKEKNEILCMLFQKTQMCFNEPDNVFLTNNYIYIINLLLKSGLTVVIFLLIKNTCKKLVWQDNLFNQTAW